MKREEQELLELSPDEKEDVQTDQGEHEIEDGVEEDAGLEDQFDIDFWIEVRQKHTGGLPWNKALFEVSAKRLVQSCKDEEDPLFVMLKKWPSSQTYRNNPDLLPGLEQQINRFLEVLLDGDLNASNKYETFRDEEDKSGKTLLHYAAEYGFLHVTKTLVKKCPGLLALKTKAQLKPQKIRGYLPVELALMKDNDDVAAYLIRQMWYERVQSLFEWRPGNLEAIKNPQPSFFSLSSLIENPKMKKTVVAVLDQMVNPHWPYLPPRKENYAAYEEEEGIEGLWNSIPEDPLEYHFYYHILDGDREGRPPKLKDSKTKKFITNNHFNSRDNSCLHVIATSNNKEALQHPVVRMLIQAKWNTYGHQLLCLQALLYVFFLVVLSFSLIFSATRFDPTQYRGGADRLRALCEVVSLIMVIFYICEELNQMRRERHSYFKEWMNLFDWLGLIFVLIIIPLRFAEHKEQWIVASLAFLFNFLRIFKFSCVTRTTGLYTKTLAKIISGDITRFMVVFAIVFFSFCGSLFLSLRYTSQPPNFGGFGSVLLSGVRALTEQQPITEDYDNFHWVSILLMLSYMGTVIVILLNILIAQMSTTYSQAKQVAKLEYDVDRILLIARMERFPLLNLRVKYYKEGDWISELKLAKELLEFTEDRHTWESVEEKLDAIREMMRKMVKQMRPGRE